MKIDTYIKATLGPLEFYFPVLGAKNSIVCRSCRMCQTDPRDRALIDLLVGIVEQLVNIKLRRRAE